MINLAKYREVLRAVTSANHILSSVHVDRKADQVVVTYYLTKTRIEAFRAAVSMPLNEMVGHLARHIQNELNNEG